MIRSFGSRDTEELFYREGSRRFGKIAEAGRRKLRMIADADKLEDLAAVPGNRMETLAGNRKGQYSIRIDDQWRVCFVWKAGAADEVEIVDYH